MDPQMMPSPVMARAASMITETEPEWEGVLKAVLPAIADIFLLRYHPFDGDEPGSGRASGFVVDAKKGLLLTNRHVVGTGPAELRAVFPLTQEEVDLTPVYRDPVHDFGICRFDPSSLQYGQLADIPLVPAEATVGTEVRVIGNDDGEEVQILSGTIGRVDREAPQYSGPYRDFNTFYIGAAAGTSPGSSGSPVVNRRAHCVALNCGGSSGSNSTWYLPLERVVRAVDLVREGIPVPRGTIQTSFKYVPLHMARQLGLKPDAEATLRAALPLANGLLFVDRVLPSGPADDKLETGDAVLSVNGVALCNFVGLEAVLDDTWAYQCGAENTVGTYAADVPQPRKDGMVAIRVLRHGVEIEVEIEVQDLQELVPQAMYAAGDSVIHTVSYTMAMLHHVPVSGLVLAENGTYFRNCSVGSFITHVNDTPVRTVAEISAVLATVPHGEYFRVRTTPLNDQSRPGFSEGRAERQLLQCFAFERNWADDIREGGLTPSKKGIAIWRRVSCDAPPAAPPSAAPIMRATSTLEYGAEGAAGAAAGAGGSGGDDDDDKSQDDKAAGTSRLRGSSVVGVQETAEDDGDEYGNAKTGFMAAARRIMRRIKNPNNEWLTDSADRLWTAIVQVTSEDTLRGGLDGLGLGDDGMESGIGVIIDKALGLVLTSRSAVPSFISLVMVRFANGLQISCRIVFLHPEHDFALLRYDPSVLPEGLDASLQEIPLITSGSVLEGPNTVAGRKLRKQARAWFLTKNTNDPVALPVMFRVWFGQPEATPPCIYMRRTMNETDLAIRSTANPANRGVYLLWNGKEWAVMGLRSNTLLRQPGRNSSPAIGNIDLGLTPVDAKLLAALVRAEAGFPSDTLYWMRSIFVCVTLQTAGQQWGLPRSVRRTLWQAAGKRADMARAVVVTSVDRCDFGRATHGHTTLEAGDVLLSVNDQPVQSVVDVEQLTYQSPQANAVVYRAGKKLKVQIPCVPLTAHYFAQRAVVWCGVTLVPTPTVLRMFDRFPGGGAAGGELVMATVVRAGSPAFGRIMAGSWILAIDGRPVRHMDDLLALVTQYPDGAYARVTVQSLHANSPAIVTVKTCYTFLPTTEFSYDAATGQWATHEHTEPYVPAGAKTPVAPAVTGPAVVATPVAASVAAKAWWSRTEASSTTSSSTGLYIAAGLSVLAAGAAIAAAVMMKHQ